MMTKEEIAIAERFKVYHEIGFDRFINCASYCLVKKSCEVIDGKDSSKKLTIILSKYIETDSEVAHQEFENEVRNLAKYFNAKIIKQS